MGDVTIRRCREDDGIGVPVHDLVACGPHRGRHPGRPHMERVCAHVPDRNVDATSDADPHQEKLGSERAGSVVVVTPGT